MFKNILLCTHGTAGARKAEALVLKRLFGNGAAAEITVLTIINEDWKWMIGDDWLNTSETRTQFMNHVDGQLGMEIEEDWDRIKKTYPSAGRCKFLRVVGPVENTIAEVAAKIGSDLIVIGPYQKKQGKGFKARMKNKKLHPLLPAPLLTAA